MYTDGNKDSGNSQGNWFINTTRNASQGAQYSTGWNGDLILVGHAIRSWFDRGGYFDYTSGAGIFTSGASSGNPHVNYSFRPVLVI
ncbi:hypothetical protein D3C73_1230950 [compost metagenome]